VTDDPKAYREMSLYWGVIPSFSEKSLEEIRIRTYVDAWTKRYTVLESGSPLVIITDIEVLSGIHNSVLLAHVS
jgi:pyruvate kinase